ncbi:MAG TPA: aminotransferase class III-fold pyridoxal phosphate-dependent enzyme [Candidatus Dormibacteraeota bacterium]
MDTLPRAAAPRAQTDQELDARAQAVLGGGSTHIVRSYRPRIYVVRAQGSRKWLIDGRELVDYTMGHGALLFGHSHPEITAAVAYQAARGTHYGAANEAEIEWAERIARMVASVERVRFTSSGTEATLLALRLARAFTGREMVAKLVGHFHGWHDAVQVDGHGGPAGIPEETASLTRVVDPALPAVLDQALGDGKVAALILEASGAHYGGTPLPPGFVDQARELCTRTGTLLVVDEVVTGFRVARGGMQELLGVRPDLSTFAKAMAGGLPGGAVGGRAAVMDLLGPAREGAEPVVEHPGTFNANPLCAAAGCAALRLIEETDAIERTSATAAELEAVWRDRLRAQGVPGSVRRLASIVHCELNDPDAAARLPALMREAGVDLFRTSAFVSTAHDDADIELTATALDHSLARLAAGS